MPNSKGISPQGLQPLPHNDRGHPMPRRATSEKSVTLLHHRLARDASMRPPTGTKISSGSPPRRDSSGESHATGQSDPKNWFDQSNQNAPAAFDHATMDVDPPFYQKHSDSSNEDLNNPGREIAYPYAPSTLEFQRRIPTMAQSSTAEDFRSVIDDLTIENKRLKEALKKYKQFGRDLLREDKLFELKIHGLPRKKRRELEDTLRDFTASLEGSPAASSTPRAKTTPKHADRLKGSASNSKHAYTSSSTSRPVDSAYASMSTGPSSIGLTNASSGSFSMPWLARNRSVADRKVENYLQDIPEGLFPRPVILTEKDKKKLVVRRLEQLFTGKALQRRDTSRNQSVGLEAQLDSGSLSVPPQTLEPSREARIQSPDLGPKRDTREDMTMQQSNCDDTQGDRTGDSSQHVGNDESSSTTEPAEQRATRPRDLDPDRAQVPSENMQYIRHLGVTAPEYLSQTRFRPQDVSIDAEGWIHLNLLCSLAQLHIFNVTPDYIRSAVSERSAKFQLSRDGRKIRWRGGMEGTKFSSDSSGGGSERSPETDTTDVSNEEGQRKRQKTSVQGSVSSGKTHTKMRPQNSTVSDGFHYKPLFTRKHSSSADTSMDDTVSDYGLAENSHYSPALVSGSGSPAKKKRRHDGAITYYTSAPFFTDLSGDPGDVSPTTYMTSSWQEPEVATIEEERPRIGRTLSGSSLPVRPLCDGPEQMELGDGESELITDETAVHEDDGFGFTWGDNAEKLQLKPLEAHLEPCGLGGVTPDDHFAVLVVTRHPMNCPPGTRPGIHRLKSDETAHPPHMPKQPLDRPGNTQMQTIAKRYKTLKPLPLPPPAMFYPPFTDTTESEGSEDEDDYGEGDSQVILDESASVSPLANTHLPNDVFVGMGVLDSGEDEDMGISTRVSPRDSLVPGVRKMSSSSIQPEGSFGKGDELHPGSSGATAGEASGYSSSESNMDEDE